MFSIGFLKFLDSYNFLAMPLDQMAKIYQGTCFADHCKFKTLYSSEQFDLDSLVTTTKSYQEAKINLK